MSNQKTYTTTEIVKGWMADHKGPLMDAGHKHHALARELYEDMLRFLDEERDGKKAYRWHLEPNRHAPGPLHGSHVWVHDGGTPTDAPTDAASNEQN